MKHDSLVRSGVVGLFLATLLFVSFAPHMPLAAQQSGPQMLPATLGVRTVVSGLMTPTTMAFIGPNDFLVLEKNTGLVRRVTQGAIQGAVLDLAVNYNSERGLLGIALHPDFPDDPGVYLFWTESSTGGDSNVVEQTPLLGNRVDRFTWDGNALTFNHNLIHIRALQHDSGQGPRGNHNGGVLAFGPDDKLYVFIGDLGRRGQLQNLPCGPTTNCPGPLVPDDQYGGPAPDNAHLVGVVLRLNPDGSAPNDNPFYAAGAAMGGEVGANVQKIFSYGYRNSFGMAFDPLGGGLWLQENGDDTFSELNLVTGGMNGGWIQIMGPVSRIRQFRQIETTFGGQGLQQLRWPPTNIATSPEAARQRLFMLPGATYRDPAFSWKWEVAPGGLNFVPGLELGQSFKGDLFMGAATSALEGGYLFHFDLSANRRRIATNDRRLRDRVADNKAKHDITQSQSLLIGRNFGATTDIEPGPNGNLYVVSITNGAVYEIFRR